MLRRTRKIFTIIVAMFLVQAFPAQSSGVAKQPVPVLLSFDVEADSDVAALRTLDINVPATYFVTGQFAEKHGRLVRELARKGTVGSHSYSHPHLTKISAEAAHKDLTLAKLILEKVLGKAPRWFRAPYLEYNETIASQLEELGFLYDSSHQEKWQQSQSLTSLPIAHNSAGVLASDYELFNVRKMSDEDAFLWLKQAYMERSQTGRPFMVLMHPRLTAPHVTVLHRFISFVREQGGLFLSGDDYVKMSRSRTPKKKGFWVDMSLGAHDAAQIVQDAVAMKATDVFLMAKDPAGNEYFARQEDAVNGTGDLFGQIQSRLKKAGIRVHAWIPVNKDLTLAQLHPEWAMVAESGRKSTKWLSPSHPEMRFNFRSLVKKLLKLYDLDGIHLDYLRYPNREFDFGAHAIAALRAEIGDPNFKKSDLNNTYYRQWVEWRFREIASLVDDIRETMNKSGADTAVLSAALIGDASVSHQSAEEVGQDYSRLASSLDAVMPMAYFKESRRPVKWISDVVFGTRYRVGNRPVYVGLEAYQKADKWTFEKKSFSNSIENAKPGSDGLVFYPYLYMFGRGDKASNLPAASRAVLLSQNAEPPVAPTAENRPVSTPREMPAELSAIRLPAVGIFVGGALFGGFIVWVISRVRRRPGDQSTGRIPRPHQENSHRWIADPGDWRVLSEQLDEETIPPDICYAVSKLLRDLGARDIEKSRLVLVLDATGRLAGSLQNMLPDLTITPEWKMLSMQYLQDASMLGLIDMSSGIVQLTDSGVAELENARANGFDRKYWEFIEGLLHDTVLASCPHCDTSNLAHWFWSDVECKNCGSSATLDHWHNVRRVGIKSVNEDEGKALYSASA